jgi:hypothetical protein
MTSREISNARLRSQKVETTEFSTAREIVSWMGAMQAQDYSMAKWAIGSRLSDPSDQRIESSIDKGEIIRIHVLRPTWHFVSSDDVYWMLELSAHKIKSSFKSRHKELGLTDSIITKTAGIIEKTMANGKSSTRDELAKRYFTSRCPATLEDFVWWSNLSVSDARKAINHIKADFTSESIGTGKYLIPNSYSKPNPEKISVHLLPAYDEFLISYKDRSSSLALINNKRTVSDNGIFHPTIVVNG